MPLVPETKMVDVNILISLGNLLAGREPRGLCLKLRPQLQFRPAFLEPITWQEFSMNTLIFQHSPSFHIFTYRANTLFPVWLPERTLSLSPFQLTESTHSSSFLHLTSVTKMDTFCNHSLPRYMFFLSASFSHIICFLCLFQIYTKLKWWRKT